MKMTVKEAYEKWGEGGWWSKDNDTILRHGPYEIVKSIEFIEYSLRPDMSYWVEYQSGANLLGPDAELDVYRLFDDEYTGAINSLAEFLDRIQNGSINYQELSGEAGFFKEMLIEAGFTVKDELSESMEDYDDEEDD